MKYGFIGLGTMGMGMAQNILKANGQLLVSDVIEEKKKEIAALGADVAENNAQLAKECDVVFLSLPNLKVVDMVVNDMIENGHSGLYILDTSTIGYSMYKSYCTKAAGKGVEYIDCPISGGKAKSDAGTLSIMVGASETEMTSKHIDDILYSIGKEIHYADVRGGGMALKIINNMLSKCILFADAEAIVMAEHVGLSFDKLFEVVSTSSSGNEILNIKKEHIAEHSYDPSNKSYSPITMSLKDLKIARELSDDLNLGNFGCNQVIQWYEMGMQRGYELKDSSSIVELMRELQPVK